LGYVPTKFSCSNKQLDRILDERGCKTKKQSASTDHGLQHQQQSLGRSSTSTSVEEGRFSTGSLSASDERSINNSAGDSRGTRKLEPAVPRSRQPAAPLLSQELNFTGSDDEGNWEESNIDAEPEEEPAETAASKALRRDLESIMPPPKRRSSVASSSSSASWAIFNGQGAASKGAANITPEDEEEDTSKAFNNGRNKPAAGRVVTRGAGKGGRGARGGRAR